MDLIHIGARMLVITFGPVYVYHTISHLECA